ncbi:MAG: aminoglycoside phosphotransferase family protein, partial [Actinomycetota bacterium]|nr:aminoglycoside phosphotransferase family protein [Actinomycetota bacterium]
MNDTWARVAANTREEAGDAAEGWISAVPTAIPELAERWALTLGEPYEVETIAYVLRAECEDGTAAVLKLIYPHYEETSFAQEVAGLGMWDGRGIVRLLASEEEIGAQLLERAEPGNSLLDEPDEAKALGIAAGALQRMWSAPATPHPDIRPLAEQARIWAGSIEQEWAEAGKPFALDLMEDARGTFLTLAAELDRLVEDLVLVHGDLHHGNVLAAEREPWLAIDPKPMLGEPEYDIRAPLCDHRKALFADPDPRGRLKRRLDTLLGELDVDRGRALAWAFAVEIDWSMWGLGQG